MTKDEILSAHRLITCKAFPLRGKERAEVEHLKVTLRAQIDELKNYGDINWVEADNRIEQLKSELEELE